MASEADDAPRHPGGRPTKYDSAFCEAVLEDGRKGLSLTAFAGGIGVARSTINEWMGQHPEFSEAVKLHQAARTRHLEETMLSAEQGPRVTARIFALKNAAPDEWKDKIAHVGGGPDDEPIRTTSTPDLANLTREQRDQLRGILRSVAGEPEGDVAGA